MSIGAGQAEPRPDTAVDAAHADARPRSEVTTLLFAVSVAVALGVACGIWVNSLMAASASRAAPPRPATAIAPEPRPVELGGGAAPPAGEAEPSPASAEPAVAEAEGTDSNEEHVERRAEKRGVDGTDAATHAARGLAPRAKAEARQGVAREIKRMAPSAGAAGRASPCALYASAGSLSLRGGGAAPLVVGGPGEAGRVSLTTPDWSNIAVLFEGRTANGWARYTVRSVSNRPGLYSVRFATPCGSKTIPVAVR